MKFVFSLMIFFSIYFCFGQKAETYERPQKAELYSANIPAFVQVKGCIVPDTITDEQWNLIQKAEPCGDENFDEMFGQKGQMRFVLVQSDFQTISSSSVLLKSVPYQHFEYEQNTNGQNLINKRMILFAYYGFKDLPESLLIYCFIGKYEALGNFPNFKYCFFSD